MWASVQAGIFITLCNIIYLLAPNAIVGACLFSLGLLMVIETKSELFTGMIHRTYNKEVSIWKLVQVFLGNLLGALLICLLVTDTNIIDINLIISRAETKILASPYESYVRALFCGFLMTMATQKDTPKIITIGCVVAFVLSNFNHCIADIMYIFFSTELLLYRILYLVFVVIGNITGGILPRKIKPQN